MRLYLVQHGKSKSKDEDPERPLTEEGRSEVERVAAFLRPTLSGTQVVIHHSGKARARETADTLITAFPTAAVEQSDGLAPTDDPGTWAERLTVERESVVLVGHLPHLARLAGLLLTGSADGQPVAFSNGGVVCLSRDEGGHWALLWSVVAALLR